jgi:hypothetical protein
VQQVGHAARRVEVGPLPSEATLEIKARWPAGVAFVVFWQSRPSLWPGMAMHAHLDAVYFEKQFKFLMFSDPAPRQLHQLYE